MEFYLADTLTDFLNNTLVRIILIVAVIVLARGIAGLAIERMVRRSVRAHRYADKLDEKKREQTLITIFHTATTLGLWVIGILVILSELNVNFAALATGAGVIGLVIGVGAQNFIRDVLAGIFIIIENQYRVGDIITIKINNTEVSGVVEEITVRITRLRDLDGNLHVVQNGSAAFITNRSFDFANVNVDIGVSYDASIDNVETVLNEVGTVMAKDKSWQDHIIEPIQFLRVDSFGDSCVNIKALGKVKPGMQWEVAGDFRRRLKAAFDKHDIIIPFPQLVVHQAAPNKKK